MLEVAEPPPPTMVEFDPGDPQGGKRTSTAHNQHDPSKAKGLDGHYGTNLKEIGAKVRQWRWQWQGQGQ